MSSYPLEHWKLGVTAFNEGRYWDAHEAWEQGWVQLEPALKLYVQSLIQIAAVFHLMELGRDDPARRLALSAQTKFSLWNAVPRIEIRGAEAFLRALLQAGSDFSSEVEKGRTSLQASLIL